MGIFQSFSAEIPYMAAVNAVRSCHGWRRAEMPPCRAVQREVAMAVE
jgi:hypothetical protein